MDVFFRSLVSGLPRYDLEHLSRLISDLRMNGRESDTYSFSIFYVTQNERNRLPRNRKGGKTNGSSNQPVPIHLCFNIQRTVVEGVWRQHVIIGENERFQLPASHSPNSFSHATLCRIEVQLLLAKAFTASALTDLVKHT